MNNCSPKYDTSPRIARSFNAAENMFTWCDIDWQVCMEGGRLIHPSFPWYWYSEQQVRICQDNSIELSIGIDPKVIKHWDGNYYHPTIGCGTMRSVDSFSYGKFSALVKEPRGYSLWPSFWLIGDGSWPAHGETDIMEAWSDNNRYFRLFIAQFPYISPSWRTTTNVHYAVKNSLGEIEHKSIGSRNISVFKQCKDPAVNLIKYECDWKKDSIVISANGVIVREVGADICNLINSQFSPDNPRVRVIFNVWCENPDYCEVKMYSPMVVKNFKYTPY